MHLPILAADLTTYLLLLREAPLRHRRVLWFWWCSPLVLVVAYYHGQLDLAPMVFLLAAVRLVGRGRPVIGLAALGLGVSLKTHLGLALPFMLIYLLYRRTPWRKLAAGVALALAPAALEALLLAGSPAFGQMVLHNEEQRRVFSFALTAAGGQVEIYLAPLIMVLLAIRYLVVARHNREILASFLGIAYLLLVVFVPPMPGWYLWSVPFIALFYVGQRRVPSFVYWGLSGGTALLILLFEGRFLAIGGMGPEAIGDRALLMQWLAAAGLPIQTGFSLGVTVLDAAYLLSAYWMYTIGAPENRALRTRQTPILVAICGSSGAGKDTLSRAIKQTLGFGRTVQVDGDDHHKWERGHEMWEQFTHLHPHANELHVQLQNAVDLYYGKEVLVAHYDHATGRFGEPRPAEPNDFVFFVGLHTLYLERMRNLMDVRIFVEPEASLGAHWKTLRDQRERGYTREQVLEQLRAREADNARFIAPQREFADIVVSFSADRPIAVGDPSASFELRLRLRLSHSYDVAPVYEELRRLKTLRIERVEDSDLRHQWWDLAGQPTADEVRRAAQALFPDWGELLSHDGLEWAAGLMGVVQLVVALAIRDALIQRPLFDGK
jgi:uridine kinase